MNLQQYMNFRLLHGHTINSTNQKVNQLIEINNDGIVKNQYYYTLNYDINTNKFKIGVLNQSDTIDNYKYAIEGPFELVMILSIYNDYYIYKLYNLQENNIDFIWVELNNYDLLTSITDINNIYVHNRLFSFILTNDIEKQKFGNIRTVRDEFKKIWHDFNISLEKYCLQVNIKICNNSINIKDSILFNNNDTIKLVDYTTNNIYQISNNIFNNNQITWYAKQYNNFYLFDINNYYYIVKFINNGMYRICQFDDKSLKINEYIKWQLNYALLTHRTSTIEYQYLLSNINNIYNDYKKGK